ncbi:MAG: hypothetical protein HQ567_23305 [Candidatus Nealsonbacteria bacterium]|nr:hypothetical protein [Candidatus Nealsonbacteria bacterium]
MVSRQLGLCAWSLRWCLAMLLAAAFVGVAFAQEQRVVRVEEDWELVIDEPAPDRNAPQVTTMFSPLDSPEGWLHATLDVNYQTLPDFSAGGMQLTVWHWYVPFREQVLPNYSYLANDGETVRWTQVMDLADCGLIFEVINGSSTTWGDFGGQGYLKKIIYTSLPSLNAYSPDISAAHSGVSYAGNRVKSLVLKRVRRTLDTEEVIEDTTERVVHAQQ